MLLTAVLTFFVALGTITVLMQLVRHMSFLPFAIYRVLLGVVLLALIYSGMPLGRGELTCLAEAVEIARDNRSECAA